MSAMRPATSDRPLAALRNLARARERAAAELCDFCSAGLPDVHQHMLQSEQRRMVCVCGACAILFGDQRESKYRRVPRRTHLLIDFSITEAQWQRLLIPIQLAFIYQDRRALKPVALYPSPAGPAEAWLDVASWEEIVALNPVLQKMEADVEALLINRMRSTHEYYIAPIDECFRLTGLLRAHWRGLSGGQQVWEEIARFFLELKEQAVVSKEEPCA